MEDGKERVPGHPPSPHPKEVDGGEEPGPEPPPPPAGGRSRKLRTVLSLALTAAFLLALALYVASRLDEFREVLQRRVPGSHALFLCLAVFLAYLLNAEILRRAARVHSVTVPFRENLALNIAASAANYFLPLKGAVGLRALYMRRRFGLGFTDFFAQLVMISVVTLGVSSLFALAGLILSGAAAGENGGAARLLSLYFGLVPVLGALALVLGRLGVRLPKAIQGFLSSWNRFSRAPALFFRIILLDLLYYLAWCAVNWLSLSAFQIRLSPLEIFFYTSLQIHALVINLTPAGLGVVEAVSVFAGSILHFSPAEALLAQGLSRLSAVAVLSLTGACGWIYLACLRKRPAA